MTKRRLVLLVQGAICVALTLALALAAIGICREGLARVAERPTESVYTPEIVAEKLASIAPLFLAAVILLIVGLALGVKDETAEKPVEDAEIQRDLMAARVARPSDAMKKERAAQKRLLAGGWIALALCTVPVAAYLANPAHFPQEDPEAMFLGLMRTFLPMTALGLGALAATSALRERSFLREAETARTRIREERATGIAPKERAVRRTKDLRGLQAVLIAAAVVLIIAGIVNQSARDVLYKAITICTECVGLG